MNVFKRFDNEFDDDDDDEDEDDEAEDELDPVELGAVPPPPQTPPTLTPVLIDGDDFKFRDDELDAAIAARINGALITVSTLDARK